MNGMISSPLRFRKSFLSKFNSAIVRYFSIVEFHSAQIMLIASLQMDQLTKHVLSYHVQYCHYVPAVTNILQHHQLAICALAGSHYIPMIIQRNAQYYFGPHILARFERSYAHGCMPFPGRDDEDT